MVDPAFSFLTDSIAIDSGVWPMLSTQPDTTNHRSLELSVQVIREEVKVSCPKAPSGWPHVTH